MSGVRLDQRLVELGHFESREKARATIMSGLVYVNGQKADKPGLAVKEDAKIEVRGAACPMSRGAASSWRRRCACSRSRRRERSA